MAYHKFDDEIVSIIARKIAELGMTIMPKIVTSDVEVLLASINICDKNRPDLMTGDTKNDITMYHIVSYAMKDRFDGDIDKTLEWYKNATQEEIDGIRVMIVLDDSTLRRFFSGK